MSANDWQSPLPPPPTWDANAPGFGSGDGGRQDASWIGWNASGKEYKVNGMPFKEISDRDPIPKWDFQEPGALVTRVQFLATRHQYSCAQTRCKTVQGIAPRNDWWSLADQFSEDQICSGQGFDLIDRIWRQNLKYRQKQPCTKRRGFRKGLLWNTRHESATNFARWRVVSKSFFRRN